MYVHQPHELCNKPHKFYTLESNVGTVRFVDTENVSQTILVKLGVLYVCKHVEDRMHVVLPITGHERECFKSIEENVLRVLVGVPYTTDSPLTRMNILPVRIEKTTTTENLTNTFIEPIVAIHGFEHNKDPLRISFDYEVVRFEHHVARPPTFDRQALKEQPYITTK